MVSSAYPQRTIDAKKNDIDYTDEAMDVADTIFRMWRNFALVVWLVYTSEQFSNTPDALSKLTVFSNGLNFLWRLNFAAQNDFVAAAATLGLVMSASYYVTIGAGSIADVYGDGTVNPVTDVVVHAVLPLEAFVTAATGAKYLTDRAASCLVLAFFNVLYAGLFLIFQPYPFVRRQSIAETTALLLGSSAGTVGLHFALLTWLPKVLRN